jgi:hypothetical protein
MATRRVIVCRGGTFINGTQYTSPLSPQAWTDDQAGATATWMAPTILRDWHIVLDVGPGSGKSWVFDVLVDGVETALTITISDTDVEGESDGVVFIPIGAEVTLRRTGIGNPSVATLIRHYSSVADGVLLRRVVYGGSPAGTVSDSASLLNPGNWNTGINVFQGDITPCPITVYGWSVNLKAAPGVGATRTFFISLDGVAQDGTLGTPDTRLLFGAADVALSTTFTLSAADNQLLLVEQTSTGTPEAANASWSVAAECDTDGESIMHPAYMMVPIKHDGTTYYDVVGFDASDTTVEADSEVIVRVPFSLTTFRIRTTNGPGTPSWYFTTRKTNADTALQAVFVATDTDGFATGLVSYVADDTIALKLNNDGMDTSSGNFATYAWVQSALAEIVEGTIGPLVWVEIPEAEDVGSPA